jgi:hypothetical protein
MSTGEAPASAGAASTSAASTGAGATVAEEEGDIPSRPSTGKPLAARTHFPFIPQTCHNSFLPSPGPSPTRPADTNLAAEEVPAGATADEAAKAAQEEPAKGTAEGAGERGGDHTDGTGAAGAPGAASATEPSASAEQASASAAPPPSRYLKAGDDIFINLPWAAGSRTPAEGEIFDEDTLAAAGLEIVDEPSASGHKSQEMQLLQAMNENYHKLQALYRARKDKLSSREALVGMAEANFQARVEEMKGWHTEALQNLKIQQEHLTQQWSNLLLKQSDIAKAEEEAAQRTAAEEARLTQLKVSLDAHEDDLAAREQALADKLRHKDEEVGNLVAQQTLDLVQKYEGQLTALSVELKKATDTAGTAESAQKDLEERVAKLEAELEEKGKEISTLKSDRDKVAHDLAEMQVTISSKTEELASANTSIEDLTLKLTTLTGTLEGLRARERILTKELQNEKNLVQSAAGSFNDLKHNVEIWTRKLVETAMKLEAELSTMGLHNYKYSADERTPNSVKLTLFLEGVVHALKQIQGDHRAKLAKESRQLCQAVLRMVLVKIAHKNPGLDLTNVLHKLPKSVDTRPLEALVEPIVAKVNETKRVEGEHRD